MTVVLKLGGSVITDKNQPETLDKPALEQVADLIAEAHLDRLVLVHGGGSFGHNAASSFGVSQSEGTREATAVREIHAAMGRLNDAVIEQLASRAIPAVPVRPFSVATRDVAGSLSLPADPVSTLSDEGFVPVLHGDVVAHADMGVTILSGDEIVTSLASSLGADRVGLCSTVPGVLDEDGQVIDHIDSFETVAGVVAGSTETDVTGGMAGKIRAMLDLDVPAHVFGPEDLGAFLAGEGPGTRIR